MVGALFYMAATVNFIEEAPNKEWFPNFGVLLVGF
jgi:hypothetical protein